MSDPPAAASALSSHYQYHYHYHDQCCLLTRCETAERRRDGAPQGLRVVRRSHTQQLQHHQQHQHTQHQAMTIPDSLSRLSSLSLSLYLSFSLSLSLFLSLSLSLALSLESMTGRCAGVGRRRVLRVLSTRLQGHLAHKKPLPPGALQKKYA